MAETDAPLADAAIASMVKMVRAAELLAAAMHITVHEAVEMQMRMLQAIQRANADSDADALTAMTSASKLKQ